MGILTSFVYQWYVPVCMCVLTLLLHRVPYLQIV